MPLFLYGGLFVFCTPYIFIGFFRLMIIYAPGAVYRHFLHVMNFNFCRRILARRKMNVSVCS